MSSSRNSCTCISCQVDYCTCPLKLTRELDFVYVVRERAKKCKCKSLKRVILISFCKYRTGEVSVESLNDSDVED